MRGFRVYDTVEKKYCPNGFYVRGDGVLLENVGGAFTSLTPADPSRYIVEESTGLVDNNGTMIYEGDIVHAKSYLFRHTADCPVEHAGVIKYKSDGCRMAEYCCVVESTGSHFTLRENYYDFTTTVLGNIHDNPELLEVTE